MAFIYFLLICNAKLYHLQSFTASLQRLQFMADIMMRRMLKIQLSSFLSVYINTWILDLCRPWNLKTWQEADTTDILLQIISNQFFFGLWISLWLTFHHTGALQYCSSSADFLRCSMQIAVTFPQHGTYTRPHRETDLKCTWSLESKRQEDDFSFLSFNGNWPSWSYNTIRRWCRGPSPV